ncbi:MAG: cation:proton antiporter [Tissierella sp.]|uniref:cation:proton antiporter n=1 Tax=Tissierella sp. TaxID=41274 RepID=UPI003F99F0C3
MDLIFKLSVIVFIGLAGARLANYLKLPNISGYVIGGLLIGPSFFNLIKTSDIDSLSMLNEIALGAIAFSIGNEFLWEDMKKVGKKIMTITLFQFISTMVVVFLAMFVIFRQEFSFSLVIASIATATAPAGILLVIRELRAKGPLVNTILPVVAIDDALGIMLFGICLSVAKLLSGVGEFSLIKLISAPLIEIGGSLIIGFILGVVLSYLSTHSRSEDILLSIVTGFIFAGVGLANILNLSPLLTCMMMSATLVNVLPKSQRVFNLVSHITPPIYLMFFTLAGSSLELGVLSSVGFVGVGYILARAGGKLLGANLGAKKVKAEDAVVKYLGMSLLPIGGVSIGLAAIVKSELGQVGARMSTIVLFSVLVFEIIGPICTKIAIEKSGESNKAKKMQANTK